MVVKFPAAPPGPARTELPLPVLSAPSTEAPTREVCYTDFGGASRTARGAMCSDFGGRHNAKHVGDPLESISLKRGQFRRSGRTYICMCLAFPRSVSMDPRKTPL